MAASLTADERAAILADLHAIANGDAPERSAGAIARAHGRARSTITRIAAQHDLGHLWDREQTAHAAAAKAVDNRARRVALAAGFLDDVDLIRERLRKPYEYAAGTKDGIDTITLAEPPAPETASLVRAYKTAFDAHLAAEKHDSDDGAESAGRSVLEGVAAALQAAYPDAVGATD